MEKKGSLLDENDKIRIRHLERSLTCMQPISYMSTAMPPFLHSARPPQDTVQGAPGTLPGEVVHPPRPYQQVGNAEPRAWATTES